MNTFTVHDLYPFSTALFSLVEALNESKTGELHLPVSRAMAMTRQGWQELDQALQECDGALLHYTLCVPDDDSNNAEIRLTRCDWEP